MSYLQEEKNVIFGFQYKLKFFVSKFNVSTDSNLNFKQIYILFGPLFLKWAWALLMGTQSKKWI